MNDEFEHREETAGDEAVLTPDAETARMEARITALETTLAERDAEITGLRQTGMDLEEKCRRLGESFAGAVTGYRTMVVKTNPEVPEELVGGETPEAIDASLESAKALVSRVRQGLEAEISRIKVPAGAPERSTPDLSSLSPAEKIRYALGGNE